MSNLTGLINRAVGTAPGWEASQVLPIQRRTTPAAPVMGTDESGKMQPFTQPGVALGVPGMISSPIKSLATSADKLEQGQVPNTEDVMPFVMGAAAPSLGSEGNVMLSAGARTASKIEIDDLLSAIKKNPIVADPDNWTNSNGITEAARNLVKLKEVPLGEVFSTQDYPLDNSIVKNYQKQFDQVGLPTGTHERYEHPVQLPLVMEYDGKFFVKNGHHRIAAAIANGHDVMPMNVIHLDQASGLINRPNITPASIANEHALDVARIEREAMDKLKRDNSPKDTK